MGGGGGSWKEATETQRQGGIVIITWFGESFTLLKAFLRFQKFSWLSFHLILTATLIRQVGKLRLIERQCLIQCHIVSEPSLFRSLQWARVRDASTWDGAGPSGRTKSTEDQDTCVFHELPEEQLASGRQRSGGEGEAGL